MPTQQGRCVCDIGLNFPLGQSTISHHLKALRDGGLVSASKKGLWVFYSMDRGRLARLGIAMPAPRVQAAQSKNRAECRNGSPDVRQPRQSKARAVG